ncbi:MAG: nucleotide-binding protein [Betaproteobacteria bacterium]|nr:nucleotide-binding protein [Betaproteobacteria bacterium]
MSTEKPPLPMLERLQNLLREGQSLTVKTDLKAIGVEFWVLKLRSLLSQLYGEKAPQLEHCPAPGRDDPKLSQQARIKQRLSLLENLVRGLGSATPGKKVFIGHGRSLEWLRLRSFLTDRLSLDCDEFNIEPTPGIHTTERLETMLSQAGMAFLVMTAEDSHADGTVHARENVVHEVGLFQGRIGSRRAIVMLEDGCAKFSNLDGLTVIYFPRNDISARLEDVRRVIEREGFA